MSNIVKGREEHPSLRNQHRSQKQRLLNLSCLTSEDCHPLQLVACVIDRRMDRKMTSHFNRVKVEDLLNDEKVSLAPHSRNSAADYVCSFPNCQRRFQSRDALLGHQRRLHAARTEYVCKLCNSSFSTTPNLNKHVSSLHTNFPLPALRVIFPANKLTLLHAIGNGPSGS